ncbi:MAG: hypothetical protein M1833_000741 [Piccolia ochrophora]|nr:MAG: hypothetical protein M1833_000741 [Piccolia ochrophora]
MTPNLARSGNGAANYTFGVEVEFFAAMNFEVFRHTKFEDLRQLIGQRIAELKPHELPVTVPATKDLEEDEKTGTDYGKWTVTQDTSIEPDDETAFDYYECQCVELISPIYWLHGSHWRDHFRAIFSPNKRGATRDPEMYLEVNTSAHLHVHVGLADRGLSFRTIRNLAILVIIFEKEVDKVLADHMGYVNETTWAKSHVHNPAFKGRSLEGKCLEIWKCKRTQEIIDTMCPIPPNVPDENDPSWRRLYKYNFMSLASSKRTIEFRQHEGTLNAEEMVHWVQFVTSLVGLAHAIEDDDLKSLILHNTLESGLPVNISDLLVFLHVISDAPLPLDTVTFFARKAAARGAHVKTRSRTNIRGHPQGSLIFPWLKATKSDEKEAEQRAAHSLKAFASGTEKQ